MKNMKHLTLQGIMKRPWLIPKGTVECFSWSFIVRQLNSFLHDCTLYPSHTAFRKIQVLRVLSDFLNEKWRKSLKSSLGLTDSKMNLENKYSYFSSSIPGVLDGDRFSKSVSTPLKDAKKPKVVSMGVQKLAKASTKGMKPLSSFFTKGTDAKKTT